MKNCEFETFLNIEKFKTANLILAALMEMISNVIGVKMGIKNNSTNIKRLNKAI